MLFSIELNTCEYEELKQREKGQCLDFFHEFMTHDENNQINIWFKRKQEQKERYIK